MMCGYTLEFDSILNYQENIKRIEENTPKYQRYTKQYKAFEARIEALRRAGCKDENIVKCPISEHIKYINGEIETEARLEKLLKWQGELDVLVVWRLDYFSLSLDHLIKNILELREKGIGFKSLEDSIDTTTDTTASDGELMFHFFEVLDSFNRNHNRKRKLFGLESTIEKERRRGKHSINEEMLEKLKQAIEIYHNEPNKLVKEILDETGVKKSTFYKYMNEYEESQS